jgi:hypothetical protein
MRLRHLLSESLTFTDAEREAKPTTPVRAIRGWRSVHTDHAPEVVMLSTTIPALALIERIIIHRRSLEHTGSPTGTLNRWCTTARASARVSKVQS